MAQLQSSQIFKPKLEVLTVNDYIATYGGGIKPPSVYYAMSNGALDWVQLGRDRFVVMTKNSRNYTPHPNKNRKAPSKMKSKRNK